MIPGLSSNYRATSGVTVSVVIPVYNSRLSLPLLIERLQAVLADCSNAYEVILVNDGSSDSSWEVIEKLVRGARAMRGINLMRNFGQHNALLCGIRAANYDVIVTMDDDLQHPPEEIPRLLSKIEEGYDVVYGKPRSQQQGLWRDFASWVIKLSLRAAMGVRTARDVSAFRAFRTHLRKGFEDYRSPYVIIDVLLAWATTRFASVEVRHEPRPYGRSNYTIARLVAHAINMTTGFSALPLRVASLLGFATCLFGAGVLAFVLGRYLIEGGTPPGFPFLASVIVIFSGVQLLALGVIGEYLGRLHFRSMDRSPYVVSEIISARAESAVREKV